MPSAATRQLQVIAPSTQKTGAKFGSGNIGISFESTTFADSRLAPDVSNLDETLKFLGSPALRFGGSVLDRQAYWTSAGGDPVKPEQIAVTLEDLTRLKKLVDATGSTVTLGIPLRIYDPKRGADMAVHAFDILDDSLLGLAIGNEPNGYMVKEVPNGAVRGKGRNEQKYV